MATMNTLPAREIKHRVCYLFRSKGWAPLDEFTLPNKRRLDVVAVGPEGGLIGVETKVSEADLRQDEKWTDYLDWVDTFYFAISEGLPQQFVHSNVGLIVNGPKKAKIIRLCPRSTIHPARRLQMLSAYALDASQRIMRSTEYVTYHNADGRETLSEDMADIAAAVRIAASQEP